MSEKVKNKLTVSANSVLDGAQHISQNFYLSDLIFRSMLSNELSEEATQYMHEKLKRLGADAAGKMNDLSLEADKNGPQLITVHFVM